MSTRLESSVLIPDMYEHFLIGAVQDHWKKLGHERFLEVMTSIHRIGSTSRMEDLVQTDLKRKSIILLGPVISNTMINEMTLASMHAPEFWRGIANPTVSIRTLE